MAVSYLTSIAISNFCIIHCLEESDHELFSEDNTCMIDHRASIHSLYAFTADSDFLDLALCNGW